MNSVLWSLGIFAGAVFTTAASGGAAELDPQLQRLALGQDSWYDWLENEKKMLSFVEALDGQFQRDDRKRVHVPRANVSFLGFPVMEITPENAGMGLGFAVTVKGPLDKVRPMVEAKVGKKFTACDVQEGLTSCTLELAPQRTLILVTPTSRPDIGTVVGCFYKYER